MVQNTIHFLSCLITKIKDILLISAFYPSTEFDPLSKSSRNLRVYAVSGAFPFVDFCDKKYFTIQRHLNDWHNNKYSPLWKQKENQIITTS